ncbi:MAG TPA: hypothetical protein VLY24_17020 [Bryobacteraceae bacterium]|nr:hypothetical protein [Bryobacteraceae bacterium]
MPDAESSHIQEGQIARAKRLRQQIERLKSNEPAEQPTSHPKSLREQIEERAREKR